MGKKKKQIAMLQQQLAQMQQQTPEQKAATLNDFSAAPAITGQVGSTGGFWSSDKGGPVQMAQYNPAQMGQMGEASKMGWEQLKALLSQPQGQPFNFQPVADLARRNFAQTTVPSIAERFASLGTGGSQRSSAFPQALSQAGGDLDAQLAAMQEQFGLQERGMGMQERGMNAGIYSNLMGMGQRPMYENMLRPGSEAGIMTLLKSLMANGAQAAGKVAGAAMFV